MLRGIDRAAFAVSLAERLRTAGVDVGLTAVESFSRALAVTPLDPAAVYWSARVTLVRRRSDLAAFDEVFGAVFDDPAPALPVHRAALADPPDVDAQQPVPSATAEDDDGGGLPWVTLPAVAGISAGAEDRDVAVPERRASDLSEIAQTPFPDLDPDDLALLEGWLEGALASWPTRRTRRERAHGAGQRIALRRTMAAARRTGWEPIELVRTRPVRRPRKVVMVCDVSQSMQAYATAYLHLMRAAALVSQAEVFAFSTSLTRLTAVLSHTSAENAIAQAGARVQDRFGGTRIAANLKELMRSHHGGALRGAIVIIASDGWDSGDPAELGAVMAKVRRRAHKVIWMNPRLAAPSFQPLVGAMAAAWPFCDEVLPADRLAALVDVVAAVGRPPISRRSSASSRA